MSRHTRLVTCSHSQWSWHRRKACNQMYIHHTTRNEILLARFVTPIAIIKFLGGVISFLTFYSWQDHVVASSLDQMDAERKHYTEPNRWSWEDYRSFRLMVLKWDQYWVDVVLWPHNLSTTSRYGFLNSDMLSVVRSHLSLQDTLGNNHITYTDLCPIRTFPAFKMSQVHILYLQYSLIIHNKVYGLWT